MSTENIVKLTSELKSLKAINFDEKSLEQISFDLNSQLKMEKARCERNSDPEEKKEIESIVKELEQEIKYWQVQSKSSYAMGVSHLMQQIPDKSLSEAVRNRARKYLVQMLDQAEEKNKMKYEILRENYTYDYDKSEREAEKNQDNCVK